MLKVGTHPIAAGTHFAGDGSVKGLVQIPQSRHSEIEKTNHPGGQHDDDLMPEVPRFMPWMVKNDTNSPVASLRDAQTAQITKQLLIKDMDKSEFTGYETTIDLIAFLPATDTRPTHATCLAKSRKRVSLRKLASWANITSHPARQTKRKGPPTRQLTVGVSAGPVIVERICNLRKMHPWHPGPCISRQQDLEGIGPPAVASD